MKKSCTPLSVFLLLGGASICPFILAQEDDASEEIFELSPFTVTAEDNDGYRATSTLAGTRLKTNLNEVGTAISIITEEFMDDTGITDASTLLTFTPNTEVGGSQGNFAGGTVTGRVNQTSARDNPQGNQRVRGLARAQNTRDYFRSPIPFDRYNTSRVTLNRGPNSILFGVGQLGGVINNTTKKASFSDMPTVFGISIDNEGGHRTTLDHNMVLIDERLAVRFNLMREDQRFQQEPAFQDDRRAFVTINSVLRKGDDGGFLGRTTLRANAEIANLVENPVNVIPPNDAFTDWFQWDHTLPKDKYLDLGVKVPGFINPSKLIPKYLRNANEGSWGKTVLGFPYFQQLGVFYNGAGDGTAHMGIPGSDLAGGQGSNLGQNYGFQTTRSIFANGQYQGAGFTDPVIMDTKVFDYENQQLTGDTNRRHESYDVQNVVVEQLLWDGKAGLEFSFDKQNYHRDSFFPFTGPDGGTFGFNSIGVDIQKTLPNSTADDVVENPNVGRPIIRNIGMPTSHRWVDSEALRATAFATLDTRDYFEGALGSWLGSHTLTGVYAQETFDNKGMTSNLYWGGNFADGSGYTSGNRFVNKGEGDWARLVVGLAYVGDSLLDAQGPGDVRITPMNAKLPQAGDVYTMYYTDWETKVKQEGQFQVKELWAGGWMDEQITDSWSGSLHSKFLDDHLITLFGYRYDRVSTRIQKDLDADGDDSTNARLWDEEFGGYAGGFDPDAMVLRDEADAVGEHSLSYSIVAKFPEQLLFELPFNSDLNVFYNFSDSWDPAGGRRSSVLGDIMGPPTGETKEYGLMLDMFDRKLSIRANWFQTDSINNTLPGGAGGAVNWSTNNITNWMGRLAEAQAAGRPFYTPEVDPSEWDSVSGPHDALTRMYATFTAGEFDAMKSPKYGALNEFVNGDGQTVSVNTYADMYELYASLVPEPVRTRLNPRYDPATGMVVSNDFGSVTGITNSSAEGFELEVTGNPIKGLRLTGNVSFQETTLSGIAPITAGLVEQISANIANSGLGNVRDNPLADANNTFGSRYDQRVESPLAAAQTKEGQVSEEQRKYRVNFVANYNFRNNSPLKGFGIGTGVRWQSEIATGYPFYRNEAGFVVPILEDAFYDPEVWSGNINLSYQKKFQNGIDWTVRVNAWNAFGTDGLQAVRRNPDGELAVARFTPPTKVTLTNTFKF